MDNGLSIKFFFLTYVAGNFYYKSVDLPEDDSIDKLLGEVREEFYSKVPVGMRKLRVFANYRGLEKFNDYLLKMFGVKGGIKSGDVLNLQPFGQIIFTEV